MAVLTAVRYRIISSLRSKLIDRHQGDVNPERQKSGKPDSYLTGYLHHLFRSERVFRFSERSFCGERRFCSGTINMVKWY